VKRRLAWRIGEQQGEKENNNSKRRAEHDEREKVGPELSSSSI